MRSNQKWVISVTVKSEKKSEKKVLKVLKNGLDGPIRLAARLTGLSGGPTGTEIRLLKMF